MMSRLSNEVFNILRQQYTEETLKRALADVTSKKLSMRKASIMYSIPLSILSDKINNKVPLAISKPGPSSFISHTHEKRLCSFLLNMSKIGYGMSKKEVPSIVKDVLDKAEADGFVIPKGKKF